MSSRYLSALILLVLVPVVGCNPAVQAQVTEKPQSKENIQRESVANEGTDETKEDAADDKDRPADNNSPADNKSPRDQNKSDDDERQENDEQQEKPLSPSEAEFQRRMKSLEKSFEKENRPERPSFDNTASKRRRSGSITFDDIKFEMEKGEKFNRKMLTDDINDLVGQRISIKGYIRPNNKNKGLKKFVFVRDDKECCFGPGAALYDCVLVTLAKGKESDFTVRPITVEGEFYLKEFNGPDRRVWAVYRMKNCRVVK